MMGLWGLYGGEGISKKTNTFLLPPTGICVAVVWAT